MRRINHCQPFAKALVSILSFCLSSRFTIIFPIVDFCFLLSQNPLPQFGLGSFYTPPKITIPCILYIISWIGCKYDVSLPFFSIWQNDIYQNLWIRLDDLRDFNLSRVFRVNLCDVAVGKLFLRFGFELFTAWRKKWESRNILEGEKKDRKTTKKWEEKCKITLY